MVVILVILGVAGAIAAAGVVDDMVADIEDDVRAEAEQWMPRGSDEAGAGDLLAEAVGAEGADLEVALNGNDGGEARAVASAEAGPVVAEVPEGTDPEQSLEDLLAVVFAEEAAAEADLWAGAAAWAEDAALEEDQVLLAEADPGEAGDTEAEAVVREANRGSVETAPMEEETVQEQTEEMDAVVLLERETQVARAPEPEAAVEQPMVADARIYEVIETVSGLSLEDVMGQGAMETAAT